MREILFRAKHKGGNWTQGNLLQFPLPRSCRIIEYCPCDGNEVEVIPETVGQFTGITDKDGTKIFEGDIIRVSCGRNRDITGTGTVEFRDGMFGIEWGWHKDFTGFRDFANPLFEVIGNIYDMDGEKE